MPSSLILASALMVNPRWRWVDGLRRSRAPGGVEKRSVLGEPRTRRGFGVHVRVAIHADEEEGRAVPIGAPHNGADVEGASTRRAKAEPGGAADFEWLLHGPDLGAHGAQVHGLEVKVTISDLENHRPVDLGPRIPSEISHLLFHGQPPLVLADSLTASRYLQASFERPRANQGDSTQKRKKIGRVLPVSFGSLRQRVRGAESDRGGDGLLEAQPATTRPSASIPSSPSRFMAIPNTSTRLDSPS